ncbi:nucleotidyltransferase [Sporocytophaga myxococcoides]|uniref:D-glycero-beta-D-manno-heptose 1-phosphate adenylyltransferase n=1 Tax=Sporocytophaga myxococcoides TaxID=153721 RepID=A0A098LD23_9BACT|nr:D-glycero-beta-D-manno-heptose 1-phosphate adenylyltransferase [Sporocytophaga myxococcoides]GAL84800.1 nucleotidyltransferase [Sporocytophaga myxococcoides]
MTSDKIQTWESIIPEVKSWKESGEKVVFTNGCFDILHLGHADYLEKSRSLGDRLIVGVNTDASVRKLKGPERPVNPEYARARLLAALEFVDAVILFDEDTPFELISHVIPDILVKGDDYKIENIVGADIVIKHGGEVKTINLVDGFSTTGIIGKIKTHNK